MAYWLEASVYSIGQDKVNNYTNVRVDLWFCRDSGSAWNGYTTYGYITVDGQRQDFSVGSYDTSGRQHIATRDFRVYHNSDGTKNVSYYCYFNADNAPYVAGLDTSGNTGLPTIPRAAGINAVNWSNIESAFNVTYSSPSSSFNYKLRVSIPNVKAIVTYSSYGSGTNKSFTQAEKNSIYQYMVDNGLASVSLGFVIETYNGTTKIGESSEPTRTITRAGISSISTNANSYTTGNTIAITIGRNNSAYTHKLYHKLNGVNLSTTTPATTESYTGMTADTFGSKYPNSTSGTLQLVLETYYNTILLGNTSKTVTINLQSYSLPTPTLSLALVNSNATVSGWGIYLKGYSQYKATIGGASGKHSSTVDKYIISGEEQTSNVKTSGIINIQGTLKVDAYYKDSRGTNSSTTSQSVTVHDYYAPIISSLTASRYNGTAIDEEGTQVAIKCAFSCASCNSKNAVSATAYIRADATSTWTTLGVVSSNVDKVFNSVVLSINTVYIIKILAKDSLGKEGAREITVTTASASIDVLKGGNGVAIGKMASVANLLDIGWHTKINGNLEVTGNLKSLANIEAPDFYKGGTNIMLVMFPVGAVYMTYTNVNPGTFLGGEWALFGQDQYIRGAGSSFWGGAIGGSGTSGATTITEAQMPKHNHTYIRARLLQNTAVGGVNFGFIADGSYVDESATNTGGGASHTHSVTPRYIAIYFWRRTA